MRYVKKSIIYIEDENKKFYSHSSIQRLEGMINRLHRELAELSPELFEDEFNLDNHMRTTKGFTVTGKDVIRNIRNQLEEYREKYQGEE